jgi:ABC-type maltose transport system permease subunit
MNPRWKHLAARAGLMLLWLVLALFLLFPFYYALVSSLRPPAQIFNTAWWPDSPTLANYRAVMEGESFGRNILNSVLVATAVVALMHWAACVSPAAVCCSTPSSACRCSRRWRCCPACSRSCACSACTTACGRWCSAT